MIFDTIYQKGYEAGVNAQKLSDHEDQNRRLQDMLHHGKKIGHDEGWLEGYRSGYECGYTEGELDAKAEIGVIDLPVVDDISEAVEEAEA